MAKPLPSDNVPSELWDLMKAIPYTFKPRDLRNWITTPRILGSIPGVFYNVVLVATDHNRALYLTPDGKPLLGHIQQFDGRKKLYKSQPKITQHKDKKPKKPTKFKGPSEKYYNKLREQYRDLL